MTTIDGASGAGQVGFEFDSIEIDSLEDRDPNLAAHVENVETAFEGRLQDLSEQIANTDDPQQQMQLEGEMRSLEREFSDFSAEVERATSLLSGVAGRISPDQFIASVEDKVSELHNLVASSYAEFGTLEVPAGVDESTSCCAIDDEAAAEVAGETMSAEMDPSQNEAVDTLKDDTTEMLDLLQNDPDAFQEAMQGLDAEERQTMMLSIQNQMQQINQLFSMMTQFSQAMHDTSQAAIQNLRV